MPGSMPATSQLDWLISMTAMIVLFWSTETRDLLRSFGWGIAALHRENAATKLPFPRRPPHSVFRFRVRVTVSRRLPSGRQSRPDSFAGLQGEVVCESAPKRDPDQNCSK